MNRFVALAIVLATSLFLWFAIFLAVVFFPGIILGCFWPSGLASVIEHSVRPEGILYWWVRALEVNGPAGWELQNTAVNELYSVCLVEQWWNLLVVTSGFVIMLNALAVPSALFIGYLSALLVRKFY